MFQHHIPGWVGGIFSVALKDTQSCVMPSQRHRDNVLSLYFSSLSIISHFLFLRNAGLSVLHPYCVYQRMCGQSVFHHLSSGMHGCFSSRNRFRRKVAGSSGQACAAYASEFLPWRCTYHENYSVYYAPVNCVVIPTCRLHNTPLSNT